MINNLKFVNEIIVWVFLTEDIKSNLIRANIRSVGPYINEIATKFGGGGHKYASGVKLKTWEDSDKLINELDELRKMYGIFLVDEFGRIKCHDNKMLYDIFIWDKRHQVYC